MGQRRAAARLQELTQLRVGAAGAHVGYRPARLLSQIKLVVMALRASNTTRTSGSVEQGTRLDGWIMRV